MENILKGRSQLLYIKISSIGVDPRLNDDELKNSRKSVNKQSK